MNLPSVSLYLPTFNQPELLRRFLTNVSEVYSSYLNLTIIILDASSNSLSAPPYSLPNSVKVKYIRVKVDTLWGKSINISIQDFKDNASDYYALANIDVFHPDDNGRILAHIIKSTNPSYILPLVYHLDAVHSYSSVLDREFLDSLVDNKRFFLDNGSYYDYRTASFPPNSSNTPRNICETVFILFRSDLIEKISNNLVPLTCPHYFADFYFSGYISIRQSLLYEPEKSLYVTRYANNSDSESGKLRRSTSCVLSTGYFPAYLTTILLLGVNYRSLKVIFKLLVKTLTYFRDLLFNLFKH
jgi:hypothetical protein